MTFPDEGISQDHITPRGRHDLWGTVVRKDTSEAAQRAVMSIPDVRSLRHNGQQVDQKLYAKLAMLALSTEAAERNAGKDRFVRNSGKLPK